MHSLMLLMLLLRCPGAVLSRSESAWPAASNNRPPSRTGLDLDRWSHHEQGP